MSPGGDILFLGEDMKTPAGVECPYFYGDYYRGKQQEECRLIGEQSGSQKWTADLCRTCPVLEIKRANACPSMILTPVVRKKFLVGKRNVTVTAFCTKSNSAVKVPEIGCGICHPLSDIFEKK
jgi:hypothetical protein